MGPIMPNKNYWVILWKQVKKHLNPYFQVFLFLFLINFNFFYHIFILSWGF